MAFCTLIKRFTSTSTPRFTDILICGGGIVGLTLACSLGKHPSFADCSIHLIEPSQQNGFVPTDSYSNRVSALSPFTYNLLNRLDIWKNLNRFRKVNSMKIWGNYSNNVLDLNDKDTGIMAYIVENPDLLQAISKELKGIKNLEIIKEKIIDVKLENSNNYNAKLPKVKLENSAEYECSLLVGSDGLNSTVRKAMNVHYISWDYSQMAIVATLEVSDCSLNTTAWQKFLPDGPIALLPLTDNLSSLVWSVTKDKGEKLLNLSDEQFVDALNSSLQIQYKTDNYVDSTTLNSGNITTTMNLLPEISSSSLNFNPQIINILENSRAAFPLGFGHAAQYAVPNAVIIGDAAHRIHPLAGQGVNLGFRDVECLVNNLSKGLRDGKDIGSIELLRKYETECQKNNVPVMAFIELIHRIYTSDIQPIQALGDTFIKLANISSPFKLLMKKFAAN